MRFIFLTILGCGSLAANPHTSDTDDKRDSVNQELGIYETINSQASIVCGEAIVINANAERTNSEIHDDFMEMLWIRNNNCKKFMD